jgi:preprotein translocase subunit YajC
MLIFGLLLLQAGSGGPAANPVLNFLPLILIFGIFYFLIMRPMQKQRRDQQQLLANLQNGNVVTTSGGIIGTIIAIGDDTVTLRVKPDNVKLLVSRSAVSGLVTDDHK